MARTRMNDAALRSRVVQLVERGAKQVAVLARDDIRRSINKSNAGGTTPSRPGEPPNKVTQTLSKSIAEVTSREGAGVSSQIGSNVEYARYLEYGTKNMEARPFLRPALQRAKQSALQTIAQVVRGGIG